MGFENDDPAFYKVILNPDNIGKVSEALAMAREEYKRTVAAEDEEREIESLVWNVPKVISYNSKYKARLVVVTTQQSPTPETTKETNTL